jgi:hypothetical protein
MTEGVMVTGGSAVGSIRLVGSLFRDVWLVLALPDAFVLVLVKEVIGIAFC